ncbi:transcriptional regulator [Escherichia phage moha]|uniref:Transcriptional regulator n=1 Tax=Escherichia phage moha TaxID=2696423 RepID=A0A6B9WWG0_9CAUD|nr:transcriptional regulator [Escherichia phage moha]
MNIVNLSTGDYVHVSDASRSKVAGKLVEVLSVSDPVFGRNEVKVRDADGNIGYVSSQFIEPEEKAFKWKLCRSVLVVKDHEFTIAAATDGSPWTTNQVAGFISDQWVEDGVKLYNIVFAGQFMVVPEFQIKGYSQASFA